MQGNTAMIIDSASLAVRCEDPSNSQVAGKLSYALVPGLPGKEQPGFYAWTLAIPKNSKNKEAAAKFVAWLTKPRYRFAGWLVRTQPGAEKRLRRSAQCRILAVRRISMMS